ncbi:MAG: EamA family transporter [Mucilaginibacter polytrichastri]|nr:EamA family transporter [Mucilaginibacter polytrichastri]
MSNRTQPSAFLVILAFATVYIVWGSTYFFIQRALHGFPPFLLGSIRFCLAGLIMLSWCIFKGEHVFSPAAIKPAAVTGLLLLFVGNGVVIWVEQFLPSAMVAILVSSAPIWFVMLDRPKWKENRASTSTITGLIIGFAGVIMLFAEQISASFRHFNGQVLLGMVMLLVGSISWSGGSLYSKYFGSGAPATVNTTWQMLAAGIAFIPGVFLTGEHQKIDWHAVPVSAWASLLYLVFMGSIAAFSAYVWLLQVRPATQVSTYAYVNPMIAVFLGVVFGGEQISMLQIGGLAVILSSVLLINLSKYRAEKRKLAAV